MRPDRVIAKYTGRERGPLLICLGGVHGNEPAGVRAIDLVGKMLEVEPITNPDFRYQGRFLGVRGNLRALEKGVRFISKDLNRSFTEENLDRVMNGHSDKFDAEDFEIRDIFRLIKSEIEEYQPEEIFVLDLHTTTAAGGIFCIVAEDEESVRLAVELHAPVITGMAKGLRGTTMDFFTTERFGTKTTCVVFEAGQHQEPLSANRAIAAIINCMRSVGAVYSEDVENRHDHLLIEFSDGLPKVAELIQWYQIDPDDEFVMLPDFKNFENVSKGQTIADDKNGPILSPADGLILMPKYQKQGLDGYFIVKKLEGF